MGWESFGVVKFVLRLFLQGQTRIAKPKSAYNSLIIDPRGMQCETKFFWKSWAGILLMWSDLTLDPLLQDQTRIPKLKSAYSLLIIVPRGLQCETNL